MKYNIRSTNIKSLPYNLTNDKLYIKVEIRKGFNPSYLENVSVELFANFGGGGSTVSLGTQLTDEFGVCIFVYNTDLIPDKTIDTAVVWGTAVIDTETITSNRTITNYIYDDTIFLDIIIIDANTPESRLSASGDYNIYDANDPATRLSSSGNYTVIDRGYF